MSEWFHPALIYLTAALIVPLVPGGKLRATVLLFVPVLGVLPLLALPQGNYMQIGFMGETLTLLRLDGLSYVFSLIFSLAAFLSLLYAWHVEDRVQQVATLAYAGAAIGATLAGDLITLFIWWEGTAISSVFLIWARRTEGAFRTGMRYLIVQVTSGVILLGGVAVIYVETGSVAFEAFSLDGNGAWLILLAFGIKCAFPLLHNWLQDAYPAATVTGTVILSAFTTKLAVYALARGFAGTELLIWIGATMVVFPLVFALIENDLRRVLAYALNTQLGFMVIGVGVGTDLALNGTVAHAVCSVLYKSLLFMSVGAVLYRTGTARASDLGGLYRTMPLTMLFCIIGAASISAFPLFSGFVSKSMIISGAAQQGYFFVWLILIFGSAAVFIHSGLKIPYFTFFARDSGRRPKEAPAHMLVAMGLTAALCIAIGVYPAALYALLPYDATYEPYTLTHIVTQMQFLWFAAIVFGAALIFGLYPLATRSINLDFDWTYRKAGPAVAGFTISLLSTVWNELSRGARVVLDGAQGSLLALFGPSGRIAGIYSTGAMVLWLAIILCATLAVNLLDIGAPGS